MKVLAMNNHSRTDFKTCTQEQSEITIPYWPSLEVITAWNNNSEHKKAQALGQTHGYESYTVEVVELLRHYIH